MIEVLQNYQYDRKITPSEWRYSVTLIGLKRCLHYNNCDYEIEDDALYYHYKDVQNIDHYLNFIEYYYRDQLHHCVVEDLLKQSDQFSDEAIKFVNEKLQANTIGKRVFKAIKFDGTNTAEILQAIVNNRQLLTSDTFKNAKFGYAGYCNANCFMADLKPTCRLLGYNVDAGRKLKGLSYNWDKSALVASDFKEFDYLPFGFTPTHTSYFINNNFSVELLEKTNQHLHTELFKSDISKKAVGGERSNHIIQKTIFFSMAASAKFLDHDVEIIKKQRGADYFETLYLRKVSIDIFKQIIARTDIDEEVLKYAIKLDSDGNYLNIMETVTHHVVELLKLDGVIEMLLKNDAKDASRSNAYSIAQLIKINQHLYRRDIEMENKRAKAAYAAAQDVVAKMKKRKSENKITSYRHKLIANLVAHNYGRFNEVLLQLSSYSEVPFHFAYELFEDFEANKNIAYTFVNALENFERKGGKDDEK